MLRRKVRQGSFFDQEIFHKMIPADYPLVEIDDAVDFSFIVDLVAPHYAPDRGRPSWDPEILFRILYLEYWANLSDVQVVRDLHYNVLYRWFCGLGWDDPVPDDTTLVVFRRLLREKGLYDRAFGRLVEQAREKGLVGGRWLIVDGTKVVTCAAVQNQTQLAREGRQRLVRALQKVAPERAQAAAAYGDPLRDEAYADRAQLLAAEIQRTEELLEQVKDVAHPEVQQVVQVLQALRQGEGVGSFTDPDARWGFQKKGEPFCGYKAVVSCEESGLVTAVAGIPGNAAESAVIEDVRQTAAPRGAHPKALAADSAYDDSALRQKLCQAGITPYISPPHPAPPGVARLPLRRPPQDLRLPGRAPRPAVSSRRRGLIYVCSQRLCQRCPLKATPLAPHEKRKRFYHNPATAAHWPRGMQTAQRIRKAVERVFGGAKVWHRMVRSPYRSAATALALKAAGPKVSSNCADSTNGPLRDGGDRGRRAGD